MKNNVSQNSEYPTINRISEEQIDDLIISLGGKRVSEDDSKEKNLNADYLLGSAIIELKLIEEEGFDKKPRQRKIAELFEEVRRKGAEVCVIDPEILSDSSQKKYFNIVNGSIKKRIQKASKQLESTKKKIDYHADRVLFLINNGYSALNHEDFLKVATKLVRNDTSKIDFLICAGIYFHTDKFDSFVIAPIEIVPINKVSNLDCYKLLSGGWKNLSQEIVTDLIQGKNQSQLTSLPVLDIEFEVDGIVYLKPAPIMGYESGFYNKHNRPRIMSCDISECPNIVKSFPKLSETSWLLLKDKLQDSWILKASFREWTLFFKEEENKLLDELKTLFPVFINDSQVNKLIQESEYLSFQDLAEYANQVYNETLNPKVREVTLSAKEKKTLITIVTNYVYVIIEENGMNNRNDLSSIYLVKTINDKQIVTPIIEHKRIFQNYAISIAGTHAIKNNLDIVLYDIDRKYSWV